MSTLYQTFLYLWLAGFLIFWILTLGFQTCRDGLKYGSRGDFIFQLVVSLIPFLNVGLVAILLAAWYDTHRISECFRKPLFKKPK